MTSSDAIMMATQQQEEFDDAIHQLVNAIRRGPKKEEESELAPLKSLLEHLIFLCGDDANRWKTFVLAITHKRYHLLSPQAKQEDSHGNVGDGERLIFYTFASVLFRSCPTNIQARLALDCLVKIAPLAGGSRDVCKILEVMVAILLEEGIQETRREMMELHGSESLSTLVGYGVRMIQDKIQQDESLLSSMNYLLQLAADTLDHDLEVIRNFNREEEKKEQQELPSTLHVFLPHRDRGKPKKKKNQVSKQVSNRQLNNSVAEILIWSRTSQANTNKAFLKCDEFFLKASADKNNDKIKSNLHILQTIIRNLRQKLNGFARTQGYMLTDQFQLHRDSLTLEQVARGKAGDLSNLSRLATKRHDNQVMKLIMARRAMGKKDKYSSVQELISAVKMASSLPESQQAYHVNRIKDTLEYLRGLIKETKRSVVICSMENSDSNHVTAVLVAATMSTWDVSTEPESAAADTSMGTEKKAVAEEMVSKPMVAMPNTPVATSKAVETTEEHGKKVKLFIGGVEKEVTCFQDFLALLQEAALGLCKSEADAPSFMDRDGIATTKAVMNVIDRHLGDSEAMLLITSGDIRLPTDVMKSLTARDCTLHCHDSDSIGERLLREKAEKGDITISLAWDTRDDLDLHVIIPGGEEISFENTISKDSPCMLDVDMNVSGGSREPVENVLAGNLDKMVEAPRGNYKVIVQNYSYHEPGSEGSTPVPFRVVIEKNGVKEKFDGQCQGAGESSNVTVHEFTYEGRAVPFPNEEKQMTAFLTSNMVNVTASTGQTLESLGRLVKTVQELEHLDTVRMLVDDGVADDDVDAGTAERPVVAERGTLEVTSRDRINMLLARLPTRFHLIVGEAFRGPSLVETCAIDISRRMVAERIPISELKRNGYPDDIVEAVKEQMGKTEPTTS